ncbi:MAG: ComF family protein [Gammaproteobacteria bacterium]|jgi:ComF family protein|nr:ComF family protein [Gammaproteobacteria bacterium]
MPRQGVYEKMEMQRLFKSVLRSVIPSAIQRLYPPRCLMCGRPGRDGADLCEHCHQQLPFNQTACAHCALPLPPNTDADAVCGRCQKKPPHYDQAFSAFSYQQPVIWLIHQLKFNGKLVHARLLGELLAECECVASMSVSESICILPVPLFRKRQRRRGFNQTIELARALSKKTGWPMELNRAVRVRETSAQTGLDAKARRKNIRGAFAVVETLAHKHVVLIDDVVTTGSTVNELSRVLKKAGVEKITVLSLARAPLNR